MQTVQTAVVFFTLMNGVPVTPTEEVIALSNDCRNEIHMIDGINRAQLNSKQMIVAWCQSHQK